MAIHRLLPNNYTTNYNRSNEMEKEWTEAVEKMENIIRHRGPSGVSCGLLLHQIFPAFQKPSIPVLHRERQLKSVEERQRTPEV